jgi:hypothetical protein
LSEELEKEKENDAWG